MSADAFNEAVSRRGVRVSVPAAVRLFRESEQLLDGTGNDWADFIFALAWQESLDTGVPQAFWYCEAIDRYGSTPLPEWEAKHAHRSSLFLVEVIDA